MLLVDDGRYVSFSPLGRDAGFTFLQEGDLPDVRGAQTVLRKIPHRDESYAYETWWTDVRYAIPKRRRQCKRA